MIALLIKIAFSIYTLGVWYFVFYMLTDKYTYTAKEQIKHILVIALLPIMLLIEMKK